MTLNLAGRDCRAARRDVRSTPPGSRERVRNPVSRMYGGGSGGRGSFRQGEVGGMRDPRFVGVRRVDDGWEPGHRRGERRSDGSRAHHSHRAGEWLGCVGRRIGGGRDRSEVRVGVTCLLTGVLTGVLGMPVIHLHHVARRSMVLDIITRARHSRPRREQRGQNRQQRDAGQRMSSHANHGIAPLTLSIVSPASVRAPKPSSEHPQRYVVGVSNAKSGAGGGRAACRTVSGPEQYFEPGSDLVPHDAKRVQHLLL